MSNWFANNFIEIFGAVTGVIYVVLEIRQNSWLWPLGLATAAAYVLIFFRSKLYADMSLQTYYVVISALGWYWWIRGAGRRAQGSGRSEGGQGDILSNEVHPENLNSDRKGLMVTRVKPKLTIILFIAFFILWLLLYNVLSRLTDSPVPGWDAFITSLSVVGTWMLARKIYEHWYLWIVVNLVSVILYFTRGLYLTVILYFVYLTMSFIGLHAWKKSLESEST
jgi:nicotinamide mononucleotide transporter